MKNIILYQKKSINLHASFILLAFMAFPFLGLNLLIEKSSYSNTFLRSDITFYISNSILIILTLALIIKIYLIKIPILIVGENDFKVSQFVSFISRYITIGNLFKLLRNNLRYRKIEYTDIIIFEKINKSGDDIIQVKYTTRQKIESFDTGLSLLNKSSIATFKKTLKIKQTELEKNFKIYNF